MHTTIIFWNVERDGCPWSYMLEIKGSTCKYTICDEYADRGGTTERTMGLVAGRKRYSQLKERFGEPTCARTQLADA